MDKHTVLRVYTDNLYRLNSQLEELRRMYNEWTINGMDRAINIARCRQKLLYRMEHNLSMNIRKEIHYNILGYDLEFENGYTYHEALIMLERTLHQYITWYKEEKLYEALLHRIGSLNQ